MTKKKIKIMEQIETVVRGNGFEFEWNGEDPMGYAFLSGYSDITTAPYYDDLYCALGEFSNVDFQTDGDKMEVWIKG